VISRLTVAALAAALLAVLPACGGADDARERVEDAQTAVEERVERARDEFEERRDRFGKRIREVLDQLEQVLPRAERTSPTVRSRGRNEATTIDAFLTELLPGESAGYGRAAGDFAVAYVLAHEYAHNLQQELGVFDNSVGAAAKPYELQADCMAGTWASSVYEQGLLEPGDLQEATDAALAVGDFDVGNAQYHGTPEERRDTLLTGFDSGDPATCSRYVPS
jgi:hypothetical protein